MYLYLNKYCSSSPSRQLDYDGESQERSVGVVLLAGDGVDSLIQCSDDCRVKHHTLLCRYLHVSLIFQYLTINLENVNDENPEFDPSFSGGDPIDLGRLITKKILMADKYFACLVFTGCFFLLFIHLLSNSFVQLRRTTMKHSTSSPPTTLSSTRMRISVWSFGSRTTTFLSTSPRPVLLHGLWELKVDVQ